MSSWARAGEDFGSRQPRRLGWVIPVAVITMALVLGLFLGRTTSPAQTVQVRTVPLAPGSTRVESGVPVGYGTLLAVYAMLGGAVWWMLRRLARAPLEADADAR